MKIYTIYINPNDPDQIENAILVEEGFSWLAAIFHIFYVLYKKIWLVGGALFLVETFLIVLQSKGYVAEELISAVKFGLLLFVGFNFNDWYRYSLDKQGYILQDIISGKNEDEARYKFMSDMLQRSTFGSSQGNLSLV